MLQNSFYFYKSFSESIFIRRAQFWFLSFTSYGFIIIYEQVLLCKKKLYT